MKIAVLSVTRQGTVLSKILYDTLKERHKVIRYIFERYADTDTDAAQVPFRKTAEPVQEKFSDYDAWIFICACGIAVRAIAPCIVSKQTDPAVVVMDEGAKFAVPILSGHIGGANALSKRLCEITGAQAAVTTATDTGGRFSPDSFAAANDLIVTDFAAAKEIAAAVLRAEKIGLCSEYPVRNIPAELDFLPRENAAGGTDGFRYGIAIGTDPALRPFAVTLSLIPKNIVLGIGCRKGTTAEEIERTAAEALQQAGIDPRRICAVSSIDRKADEAGLVGFCAKKGLPFHTYSAAALRAVPGTFTPSGFVQETVGVDNVCERSAVLLSGGAMVLKKYAGGGVTIAAAERPVVIDADKEISW